MENYKITIIRNILYYPHVDDLETTELVDLSKLWIGLLDWYLDGRFEWWM